MKQSIDNLIDLAKKIRKLTTQVGFGQKWTHIRNVVNDYEVYPISVYFASNYDTCSVRFGENLEVSFISDTIEIPFEYSSEELKGIYRESVHTYEVLEQMVEDGNEEFVKNIRKERIQELKRELESLLEEDSNVEID